MTAGPPIDERAPSPRTEPEAAPPKEAPRPDPEAPEPMVEDPMESLAAERDAAAAERDRYLDALRRTTAEFDNFRKRTERDRQASATAAARELVTELLPVLDNLEAAGQSLVGQPDGVVAGVQMVRSHLGGVLARRGVQEIEADGRPFDPTVHEAVATTPSPDHAEGTVVQVVQRGYRLSDAVLRPARVVVSAAPGPIGD